MNMHNISLPLNRYDIVINTFYLARNKIDYLGMTFS